MFGEREAMQQLGRRIRAARLGRNLPQAYFTRILGLSRPTYRKIEAGDGTVEFRHVAKTLGILGLSRELGELVPEIKPEVTLRDLLQPERQRASRPRSRP